MAKKSSTNQARTLEFALAQKKSQNNDLKPEISFEILNVALAADAFETGNADGVIQKHMKRVQKGIDRGLISPTTTTSCCEKY